MDSADIEQVVPLETGASMRPKRERSAAQMEAFERAREKRAAICAERRAMKEQEKIERKAQRALEKQRRKVCDEMAMIPPTYEEPDVQEPEPREAWPVIDMDELCSNLASRLNKIYAPEQQKPKPQAPQIRFV